jgi:hypothetical protein
MTHLSHFHQSATEPSPAPHCQECDGELAADSPDLRLELTCDDEPIVYVLGARVL